LKAILLEKLEHFLIDIQLIPEVVEIVSPSSHEVSLVREFSFHVMPPLKSEYVFLLLFHNTGSLS
jgi:hypothetical protein